MNAAFWNGKRVLLTGHTGFKGSWLALWLFSMGARVAGYSLAPLTRPNLFETASVSGGIEHQTADIRDFAALSEFVRRQRPEVVFHLAAQSLVRRSYQEPLDTYNTNVLGTAHLLEAVRQAPSARAVIVVTSDKCYENQERIDGYRESDPMGGHDPYSSSKGCAELVTAAYRASFFNPARLAEHGVGIASARAGNVIGGGDWSEDRLIPDLFRAVVAKESVHIRNPRAIRPWQHVLEPLAGYLLLAERLCSGAAGFAEGWNFGPPESDARPVAELVEAAASRWEGLRWQKDDASHPHEATLLRLDSSKARTRLRWQPRLDFGRAVEWTVDWYKAYLRREDMRRQTLAQIERYARLEAI